MRRPCSTVMLLVLGAVLCILAAGCLERTETITVNADGSVDFFVQFESESREDIQTGDAVPKAGSGWEFDERTIEDADGNPRFQLWARKRIKPERSLPSTFARPGDPQRAIYLQFPTELNIEERSDGIYYHFKRTYEPRQWAQFSLFEEEASKRAAAIEEQVGVDGEITETQKRAIIGTHADAVIDRFDAFARQAFLDANRDAPQDAYLAMHEALTRFKREIDYDALMGEVNAIEDSGNGERFDDLMRQFEEAIRDRLEAALRQTGRTYLISGFLREYDRVKAAYEVSRDLNDESFSIRLGLPGEIVATNAHSRGLNGLEWKFGGKMLHDRRIEILATSRVSNR